MRCNWRVVGGGATTGLGVLWLANLALGKPTSYDSGLYHFSIVEYATRFAAIPGLGNLHERLGASDPHLLLVAMMGTGPWPNAGFHLVNGLLVVMLLADITWRLAAGATPPFTRRVALLLVPATFALIALDPGGRLSSPSLDSPAFVLVAAATLYVCHCAERFELGSAMAATGAFATVSVTRPYFLPATVLAGLIVAASPTRRGRVLGLISVIPGALLLGWAARQAVLTGYPLFPLQTPALPVDWLVPGEIVSWTSDWVRSWARTPRESPETVLASWKWLPGWLSRTARDADVLIPLVLFLLALVRLRRSHVSSHAILVLAPLLLTIGIWFFSAPDPRFAYGPLWLVPIVLLACRPLDLPVAIVSTTLAAAAIVMGGGWPLTERGGGPLGSFNLPEPIVEPYTTRSGLDVQIPAFGDDRCWRTVLCSPKASADLRLRGSSIADGFGISSDAFLPTRAGQ